MCNATSLTVTFSTITGGEKYEKINIFSLASGHLYERFMRIMMLSVMKHTKHPVKFWVLNNYLSPQFRVRELLVKKILLILCQM